MSICKSCGRVGTHNSWCTKREPRRTHRAACTGRHCAECTPTNTIKLAEGQAA